MIPRPTTERLILECCHHLMEQVAPHVVDADASQALVMIETMLRNTAVRAAHEIAWMTEEIDAIAALQREAATVLDGDPATVDDATMPAPASQHLDDVVAAYTNASAALAAMLSAPTGPDRTIQQRAQRLLDDRLAREAEIMGAFAPTGRD